MPIADKLLANNMITQEKHSKITARVAHQDKIRLLLSVVNSGDAALKLSFFKVLKEEEPILIQELEGLKKDGTEVAIKRTQSRKRQKTMEDQDFVRKHFSALVNKVKSVMPIADKLLANNMITQEKHSKITARVAHQDKIRLLLSVVNSGGPALKSCFFEVLKEEEPILIQELEGLNKDGTEVAIKRTRKNPLNSKDIENETKHLQDLTLESRKRVKTMKDQDFVNKHFSALVKVKSVMPIADKLLANKMITQEKHSEITARVAHQDKTRHLLFVVNSGGAALKSCFFKVLKEEEPILIKELEGSSSQTSPGIHIRWKSSSNKHKSKLEEFRKDISKKQIGSIFFSKNDKYLICSESSGICVYLGLKQDGTEIAIKRIIRNSQNDKNFENELKHLQDLKLESKNIVRYVDFEQDEDFHYLALQLCEYDLEGYMDELRKKESEIKVTALKKVVKEVLLGLQVLHRAKVIHRDIKPQNILIDSGNNARLADFDLSRILEDGSTVYTARAGTRCWEAVETLDQSGKTGYKMSSDVQVAGMLVYYILSDGKHPFKGNGLWEQEANIRKGNYSLDEVDDVVAKDLIERMINKVPEERPTIHEVLNHPYFWDDVRKKTVLSNLGDRKEVQYYEDLGTLYNLFQNIKENSDGKDPTAEQIIDEACNQRKIQAKRRKDILKIVGEDLAKLQNLCDTAKKYTKDKTFSNWKRELSEMWNDISKKLPDDTLGLLRALRNKMVHAQDEFKERNMLNHFPDFFISLYGLAKDLSWKIDDAEEKP
ncbi:uncharacterized protein [Misgurnus anguillicaudatus]